jgi:hypothetical protein
LDFIRLSDASKRLQVFRSPTSFIGAVLDAVAAAVIGAPDFASLLAEAELEIINSAIPATTVILSRRIFCTPQMMMR